MGDRMGEMGDRFISSFVAYVCFVAGMFFTNASRERKVLALFGIRR